MALSFKEAKETEVQPASKAVAVIEQPSKESASPTGLKALAFQNNTGESNDMEGEYNIGHLKLPYVSLIQKTSDNSQIKAFGLGSVVFNKEVKLCTDEGSWEFTPLRASLVYVQNVEFGETPIRYKSSAEVLANGGNLRYSKDNPKDPARFDENLYLQIAVRAPDDLDEELAELFPYEKGEYRWALAMLGLKGGGLAGLGKLIIGHRALLLKGGLHFGRYTASAGARSNSKGEWWVHEGKFLKKHDAETAEFLKSLV